VAAGNRARQESHRKAHRANSRTRFSGWAGERTGSHLRYGAEDLWECIAGVNMGTPMGAPSSSFRSVERQGGEVEFLRSPPPCLSKRRRDEDGAGTPINLGADPSLSVPAQGVGRDRGRLPAALDQPYDQRDDAAEEQEGQQEDQKNPTASSPNGGHVTGHAGLWVAA